ncbi:hypothetical protein AMATHDRAFT_5430 [Amanita thiersii Skay4041]|uniref:Uncharacterized protein n=1 Tax=Amanita thiersii Skay4041 TaxID=703135 RepID=A0A2A9NE01_9AGAR|nr:hypothetical protein AMATHDRAFT_5430 [Amanita thiersii Skay4041]
MHSRRLTSPTDFPTPTPLPPYAFIIQALYIPEDGYTVCLWKNGKFLTIQLPTPSTDPDSDVVEYFNKEYLAIQEHLSDIVLGKTNWAYFLINKDGKRTLAYRQRPMYKIKYPPYAPLIHEDEIQYIRPVRGYLREGLWKGRHVDVWVGWNDHSLRQLERQMRSYDLLRSLDVTYGVLGHIIDSQGNIIGMVTEPAYSRPFQATDLLAIDDAMARMRKLGIYYTLNECNVVMSLDGKVRFTHVWSVRPLKSGEEEFERLYQQKLMQQWYLHYHNRLNYARSQRYEKVCPLALVGLPSLAKSPSLFTAVFTRKHIEYKVQRDPNTPISSNRLPFRYRAQDKIALAETTRVEEVETIQDGKEDQDVPLRIPTDRKKRKHYIPYARDRRRERKVLLAPE